MTDAAAGVDPKTWAVPPPRGLRRFLPILTWLPAYDRRWLRFDVIAGATVWGLLVPEMIAYSALAGLPPQAGLYTLLASLAAYAIFGTSRHVVVAGTSASAVLIASGVGRVAVFPAPMTTRCWLPASCFFAAGSSLRRGSCGSASSHSSSRDR